MAEKYEHEESKGSLWPNDKAKEEPHVDHPSLKGTFKWKGETLEIAAWTNETKTGKKYLGLQVGHPRSGKNPKAIDDSLPSFL